MPTTSPREHLAVLESLLERFDDGEIERAIALRVKVDDDPRRSAADRECYRRKVAYLVAQRDSVRWVVDAMRAAFNKPPRPTVDQIAARVEVEVPAIVEEGVRPRTVREIVLRALNLYKRGA